ncbi:pyridoxal phosphate phosphatase-like [Thrips palmi]|uniref:Pyridoxal phosphate phosphatase-like n=1 Tax=Thrips palmi TaxID=161013 RepID=A0A6P8YN96_THRPL|nr:pyridoxal phosphate phosphatase-like [Thrips palmi]
MADAAGAAPRRKPVKITKDNVSDLMAQVDAFVLDCDGVIWTPLATGMYPKAEEALDRLRGAGKKVMFVSNNSFHPPQEKFKLMGYPVSEDEVVVPSTVIARYLKKRGFEGQALVLASETFKRTLQDQGIDVVQRTAEDHPEKIIEFLRLVGKDAGKVKAVIVDFDLYLTGLDLVKAANYLREDPECLFFACATECNIPVGGKICLGPGYWTEIVERASGRKAQWVGKPAPMMVTEFLKDAHQLDMARSIFVGDSLEQDMGIANNCGMKKLLVLTGMTAIEDLETCDPNLIPDYYIDSVADLGRLLPKA